MSDLESWNRPRGGTEFVRISRGERECEIALRERFANFWGTASGEPRAVYDTYISASPVTDNIALEAGKAYVPTEYPDVIANADRVGGDREHDHGYHTQGRLGLGHDVNAIRGKVLGGRSGVNAAVAMRARPSDFAGWSAHGIQGWSFEDVLPIYKSMENTPTGDDAWHERSGPFPIHQRTME